MLVGVACVFLNRFELGINNHGRGCAVRTMVDNIDCWVKVCEIFLFEIRTKLWHVVVDADYLVFE